MKQYKEAINTSQNYFQVKVTENSPQSVHCMCGVYQTFV